MKIILTKIKNATFCGLYKEGRFLQMDLSRSDQDSLIGNIYVGRIQNVVNNIGAVFVEYQKDQVGYLRLSDMKQPFYTSKKGSALTPVIGDELLVEVTRDAIKTKPPSLSTVLTFPSPTVVLTPGDPTVGVSAKISSGLEKKRLKSIVQPYLSPDCGFVLRTASEGLPEDSLMREIEDQIMRWKELKQRGMHAKAFTCLRKNETHFLCHFRASELLALEEVVTDSPALKEAVEEEFTHYDLCVPIRYYEEEISLTRLYQIEHALEKALQKRVWLSSGAYLVIEQTEALTVIDVNTGKAIHGKGAGQETFYKINLEAAKEAARQIRLRNLGGIILVDFIDLNEERAKKALLSALAGFVEEDATPCQVVDITKLQLVELTRKTIRPSLKEQAEQVSLI